MFPFQWFLKNLGLIAILLDYYAFRDMRAYQLLKSPIFRFTCSVFGACRRNPHHLPKSQAMPPVFHYSKLIVFFEANGELPGVNSEDKGPCNLPHDQRSPPWNRGWIYHTFAIESSMKAATVVPWAGSDVSIRVSAAETVIINPAAINLIAATW